MPNATESTASQPQSESTPANPLRIVSLDAIRGVAILGILFMNLFAIGLPFAAYESPNWSGQYSQSDLAVFSFQHLFFDGRFMGLFCLLFGAGMVLFQERATAKGYNPRSLLQRRLSWLLLFGVLHGALVWAGDILFLYALCGLMISATQLLQRSGTQLLRLGTGLFVGGYLLMALLWGAINLLPDGIKQALNIESQLTPEALQEKIELWTGPYLNQVTHQMSEHLLIPLGGILIGLFWSVYGVMLMGAGLYRLGVFERGLNAPLQWGLLAAGLTLSGWELYMRWQLDFSSFRDNLSPWNLIAAIPIAIAYLSLLTKLCQRKRWLPLERVGRMAFSLYIFQSTSMVLLFRWLAPELYGVLDRIELFAIAATMTLLQIALANIWLRFHTQGPLEKLWRHLLWRNSRQQHVVSNKKLS